LAADRLAADKRPLQNVQAMSVANCCSRIGKPRLGGVSHTQPGGVLFQKTKNPKGGGGGEILLNSRKEVILA
jgi:hypothetical protein